MASVHFDANRVFPQVARSTHATERQGCDAIDRDLLSLYEQLLATRLDLVQGAGAADGQLTRATDLVPRRIRLRARPARFGDRRNTVHGGRCGPESRSRSRHLRCWFGVWRRWPSIVPRRESA
jgi:hypothetical protein